MNARKPSRRFLLMALAIALIAAGAVIALLPRITDQLYRQEVQKQKAAFLRQLSQGGRRKADPGGGSIAL